MQYASDLQKSVFEKVLGFMEEIFGEGAVVTGEIPMVSVMIGSAVVLVSVLPFRDDEVVVTTRSIVVSRPRVDAEMAVFLLRANASTVFGAFGLTARGDVVLEHNIMGSAVDREQLRASIATVAQVADEFDDIIVARWGGDRALDKMDSLARLMESHQPGEISH